MSSSKTSKDDNWRITLSNDAAKFYRNTPEKTAKRLYAALKKLAKDPLMRGVRPVKSEKGVYRFRVGYLRILFGLNTEDRIVEVYAIVSRSKAYKKKG